MTENDVKLTADKALKLLEGMSQRCGSCKFLKGDVGATRCTVHNKVRTSKDDKCEDWRYFV